MNSNLGDQEIEKKRKIEKMMKELGEHQSDPFKPFREIVGKHHETELGPQRRNKLAIGKVGWTLLLLSLIGLAYGGYKYLELERASKLRQALEEQSISNLATRYNAVIDWRKPLEQLDEASISDIQAALIRKDGRPLLISVNLMELVKADNKYQARFSEFGLADPEVDFILECTPEQVSKLRERPIQDNEFAVIASITSVKNPEDSQIQAKGLCLDLLPLDY